MSNVEQMQSEQSLVLSCCFFVIFIDSLIVDIVSRDDLSLLDHVALFFSNHQTTTSTLQKIKVEPSVAFPLLPVFLA